MPDNRPEHTVRAFDDELKRLSQTIIRMGGLAEAQVAGAVEAMSRRNTEKAGQVVQGDAEIDRLEHEVDEQAVQLLALRQPMARDLREVVAALKISADLERIGDYAANVAKRSMALNQVPQTEPSHSIPRMAQLVLSNIKRVLDAYVERDPDKAIDVWESDAEVDEMYTALFRETLTYMMEDPRNITPCTHLLFIAKNVERMGDHATNIAEVVHFLVTGIHIEGGRPKGDTSSYAVVAPPDGEVGSGAGSGAIGGGTGADPNGSGGRQP
jgi:phosphate transport system protein